jgi:hypothetical protein
MRYLLFGGAVFVIVIVAASVKYALDRPTQRPQTAVERIYAACWREFGHNKDSGEADDAVLRRVNECIKLATDRAKMDRVLDAVSAPK